jgi:hypothetical protein
LSICKRKGLISAGRDESFNKGATADKNVRQYLKIFGLPLNEVQKHLSQTPAPVKVNVSLSGNNSKRGSSSARGSSFPSQDKSRKMIIDGGNKGGPKKFSVPRSKPGRSRGLLSKEMFA